MKYLLTVCLFAIGTMVLAQNDSLTSVSKNDSRKVSVIREVKYNGEESLNDFIDDNLSAEVKKYIRKNNLQNKIYAQMNINTKGEVTEVIIPGGENDFLVSNELIRILKMTKWMPATNNGSPIHRKVLVPLEFSF